MESNYALVIIQSFGLSKLDSEKELTVHTFETQEEARAFMLAKIRDLFTEEYLDAFVPDAEGCLRYEDDIYAVDATLTPDFFTSYTDGDICDMYIVKIKENTL